MLAGKTLIARQIGKLLNAVEPKIVNGPEVLDKFVGESEKKVRELFADAERDEAALAEDSPLHVIIFDEIAPTANTLKVTFRAEIAFRVCEFTGKREFIFGF